jgi:hypothetical protein
MIPEIIIANLVETVLKVIETDFNDHVEEKDTLLYYILGDNQYKKFYFFEQAKDIFLREYNHPRKIEVRMLFDAQRASLPTIHITMPQENNDSDGIGVDEGYEDNILNTDKTTFHKTYTRAFGVQYNIIITSDNSLEVLLIYHLLKAMLISIFDHMELSGIRNPKLSGQDLQMNSDIVPVNVFVRGVGINFMYEESIPAFQEEQIIKSFTASYTINETIQGSNTL